MLIDALANEPTTDQKILWFLVIFFLHFIGAFVYLFVRKSGTLTNLWVVLGSVAERGCVF